MPISVMVKVIDPKTGLFDDKRVRKDVQRINKKHASRLKRQYAKTTRTWNTAVRFYQKTSSRPPDIIVSVGTDNMIYKYVSEGTDRRYAVMTKDFSPKTRPYVIRSYRGRGGFAYLDLKNPRRGIRGRRFAETIAKEGQQPYQADLEAALRRAEQRARRTNV